MNKLAGLLLTLALTAAACGASDEGDDDGGSAGDVVRQVEAVEFGFTPDLWLGDAGGTFTIEFSNAGSIEHNWVVLSRAVESEDEITDDLKLFTMTTAAGASQSAQLPQLDAGTYQVVCDIAGHFSAGMEGELRISG